MHQEPRSAWALIVIILVIILFGLFWYTQEKKIGDTVPTPVSIVPQKRTPLMESPLDLQASVEAIEIPDYSDME
jgi:hypothetical protein